MITKKYAGRVQVDRRMPGWVYLFRKWKDGSVGTGNPLDKALIPFDGKEVKVTVIVEEVK